MVLSLINGLITSTIMLLSETEKFLFVHIQKTAGTSLTQHLKTHLSNLDSVLKPHDPLLLAQRNLGINLDDYFKVAFVRNPFDRLVSWYSMIMTHGIKLSKAERLAQPGYNKIWQYVLTNSQNFDEFLIRCFDAEDRSGWKPFLFNQVDYLKNDKGVLSVDFIGRFETITQDSVELCKRLNIKNTQIPHKNKSSHEHYRHYYNSETRTIVEKRFAEDLDYFGYQF